jgi:hypothetical protein
MKKGFRWIVGVGILAMLVAPVCGEDWVKLAAETDEPAFGMRIEAVVPGSQAESIGLKPGDTIYQMGDHAMRGFVVRSRAGEETLFFCRGGKKGSAQVRAGKIGIHYVESFRPQLAYLRGEIGRKDPRWDAKAVASLALLPADPAAALKTWQETSGLGYPDDELDVFVRNLAAWKLGKPFSARKAYEAVDAEFKIMPRLYAAFLEDMAYASGQIDVLRKLREADPDSSTLSSSLADFWEEIAARPTAERNLLDLAKQRRGADLLPELAVLPEDKLAGAKERIENLKAKGTFSAPPDRINTTRVKLPDTTKDCHFVLVFELHDAVFSETALSRARLGLYAGRAGKRLDQPVLAELTVSANPYAGTLLSARGGQDGSLHQHLLPGRNIPVKDAGKEGERGKTSGAFRIDLIRLDGEAAVYCDGVPYCHLPIDRTVDNFELQWLVSGISARISSFEAWSLQSETPLENP